MCDSVVCIHSMQGRAGQGRAGQGRAGQGRAGQGRAGQGRAGQGWVSAQQKDISALPDRNSNNIKYIPLNATDSQICESCEADRPLFTTLLFCLRLWFRGVDDTTFKTMVLTG